MVDAAAEPGAAGAAEPESAGAAGAAEPESAEPAEAAEPESAGAAGAAEPASAEPKSSRAAEPRSLAEVVERELEAAIAAAERHSPSTVAALDAGCGRVSALRRFRPRIARLVGADIHAPTPGSLPHLDEFATADLCTESAAFPPGTFDVVLSSFTAEHFADPEAAFRNLHAWLRPGGRLVITTVNRRHPFVWAYLSVPGWLRGRLQRLVKATAADAHPLVGACNTPTELADALGRAGFSDIGTTTVGHLERAWGRRLPTRLLGRLGDALAASMPSRRSTIVVGATAGAFPSSTPG